MKRIFSITAALFAAALTLASCGGNCTNGNCNSDNTTPGATAINTASNTTSAIEVDALLGDAAELTDKEVTVEGICTHICRHGGKKIFLMGSDDTQVIRIEAGEAIGAFDAGCVNNVVRVKGRLVEDRIDEAYLAAWERRVAEATDEQHGTGEAGCSTEKQARGEAQTATTEQRIADFRTRIADREAKEGKAYLSFYHVAGESYEIVK